MHTLNGTGPSAASEPPMCSASSAVESSSCAMVNDPTKVCGRVSRSMLSVQYSA